MSEINTRNVSKLRQACTFDTGETVPLQSDLVMVGGVIYFTTFKTTYAVNATTCTAGGSTTVLSEDGNSKTVSNFGYDSQLRQFKLRTVWDRQA